MDGGTMLDVTVVLLDDGLSSTAIMPVEIFHSAGALWNDLHDQPPSPAFRVRTASLDGGRCAAPTACGVHAAGVDRRRSSAPTSSSSRPPGSSSTCSWWRTARCCPGCAASYAQGAYDRRRVHGRGLSRRGRAAGRPRRDHALGGGRPARGALPEGPLAARDVRHRGHAGCCAAAASSPRSTSASTWSRSCAATRWRCSAPRPCCCRCRGLTSRAIAMLPVSQTARRRTHPRGRGLPAGQLPQGGADPAASPTGRGWACAPSCATSRPPPAACPPPICRRCASRRRRSCWSATTRPIQSISSEVGYDDVAFFRSLFKRITGMTPAEYRSNFAPLNIGGRQAIEMHCREAVTVREEPRSIQPSLMEVRRA